VSAHVAESLCDGFWAGVRDAGVATRALFGFGNVPGVGVNGGCGGGNRLEGIACGRIGGMGLAYQCGQRNVASEVVRGAICVADRFGVVRRFRTGDGVAAFGLEVGADVG
jgi:hypothetical protein